MIEMFQIAAMATVADAANVPNFNIGITRKEIQSVTPTIWHNLVAGAEVMEALG